MCHPLGADRFTKLLQLLRMIVIILVFVSNASAMGAARRRWGVGRWRGTAAKPASPEGEACTSHKINKEDQLSITAYLSW